MITEGSGNLLLTDADALVNTVNTVGVMGKGIALQFKRAYPENYNEYKSACDSGEVAVGRMHVHATGQMSPRFIVNFPTKRHWRSPSRLEDVSSGLTALRDEIINRGITSIAVPPLGCGNGGLNWVDIEPMIRHVLGTIPGVEVRVWQPAGSPAPETMPVATAAPDMTQERASFLAALSRYIRSSTGKGLAVEERISLLEAHKVVYLLQRLGLPLGLQFEKGIYGPYAPSLDRAVSAMEGHFVVGFGDGTSGSQALLELNKDAVVEAEASLAHSTQFQRSASSLLGLVDGFEDAFGMELLSTVLFASESLVEPPADPVKVTQCIQTWNPRKRRMFTSDHVETAWTRLLSVGLVRTPAAFL